MRLTQYQASGGQCEERQVQEMSGGMSLWEGRSALPAISVQPPPLSYQGLEALLKDSTHLPKLAFSQLLLES